MSFEFSQANIIEGESVTLCADIVGGVNEIPFNVSIFVEEQTTEGEFSKNFR